MIFAFFVVKLSVSFGCYAKASVQSGYKTPPTEYTEPWLWLAWLLGSFVSLSQS